MRSIVIRQIDRSGADFWQELLEAQFTQALDQHFLSFIFFQAVQDSEQHAAHHDTGDSNYAHGQPKRLQVGKDFIRAAVFAKLLSVIKHLDAAEIRRPLVVKRAVHSASMLDPEPSPVDLDSMAARHD